MKKSITVIGVLLLMLPVFLKAQCSGSWAPTTATLNYLCANGPFLQHDLGPVCPGSPQVTFTFTSPVTGFRLKFSALGTLGSPGASRLALFLNDSLVDLNQACSITLGCQSFAGAYSINNGCLVDIVSGSDGGISGYINIDASLFGLPNITSVGVAVSEPTSSGTIFQLDSCYTSEVNCLPTGMPETFPDSRVLYPNPFAGNLEIHIGENENIQVTLYDISMRKVMEKTFMNSVLLSTEELKSGIYFCMIRNDSGIIYREKLVKH